MSSYIYLDNSATTRCLDEVFEAMTPFLLESFGNPGSTYSFSSDAKRAIAQARHNVAQLLNVTDDEIVFTSGASEGNTAAILSAIRCHSDKRHIIATSVEHSSVIEALSYLADLGGGYDVSYLKTDKRGRINLQDLKAAIRQDTCLIIAMMANNEIGNIYPVAEIGKIAKAHGVLFHSDITQAVGKIRIDMRELGATTAAFSGHKIGTPKGVGVLYVKAGSPFVPLIFGHQERGRRGGTENVPYIVGLGKAVERLMEDDFYSARKVADLRDYMESQIKHEISDTVVYGDHDNRLPGISSIAFHGIDAEKLLLMLDSARIYVSTGSACNSEFAEPSHVLTACHADLRNYSPIRVSLCADNTRDEIDYFVNKLATFVNIMRRKS